MAFGKVIIQTDDNNVLRDQKIRSKTAHKCVHLGSFKVGKIVFDVFKGIQKFFLQQFYILKFPSYLLLKIKHQTVLIGLKQFSGYGTLIISF